MVNQSLVFENHQTQDFRKWTSQAWVIPYIVLVSALLYFSFYHWAYDDPFITYRYAWNLANGLGFVYNPGERVLSTTTPLFALLLSALQFLWDDIPHLANLIGAFSLAVGGILLWDLAKSWKTPLAGWAGLLLYPTFPLLLTTLGSEIPLYLAFCLGTFVLYARQKYSATALCAALATLTRPDGIVVPLILASDYLVHHPQTPQWKAFAVFLCLILPWILFAWGYFGTPVPATLSAKQHQGSMFISQRFAEGLLSVAGPYLRSWTYRLEMGLALVGIAFMFLRSRRWIPFFAWPIIYSAAYTLLGVSRYFWYYSPLVPGFVAAIGLGATAIASWASPFFKRFENLQPKPEISDFIVGGLLIIPLLIGQSYDLWHLRQVPDQRYPIYRTVGEWLRDNTSPDTLVGALEVGIIGYYAQRPMVDFAGLIQPDVAERLTPATTYTDSANWAARRFKPDYLALNSGGFVELEQSYAAQHCELVKSFVREQQENTILLYKCNADQ